MPDNHPYPEADRLLKIWAAVAMRNGPIRDADSGGKGDGAKDGYDHPALIRDYVERTLFFGGTKPILRHVYVEGLDLSSYRFVGMCELYEIAILRHSMLVSLWGMRPVIKTATACLERFLCELEERAKVDPPPPDEPPLPRHDEPPPSRFEPPVSPRERQYRKRVGIED